MRSFFSLFIFLIFIFACNNLSPQEKKQLKKAGKEIAKQITATIEHADISNEFIGFEANPDSSIITMKWKKDDVTILGNLGNLKTEVEASGSTLLYACNGGMYMQNQSPLGYYIENGKVLQKINIRTGSGNFYLKPKGVFYIENNNTPSVQSIELATDRQQLQNKNIKYLTQSGPMLIHKNEINLLFTPSSNNINIRNGVGILPNGNAYFAMSTYPINFYNFAKHFKNKGCKEALYFDGFVSQTYCPQLNYSQLGGGFGVMIAVVKK